MEQLILKQINEVNSFCLKYNTSYINYHYSEDNSLFCQIVINYHHIYLEIFFNTFFDIVEDVVINVYRDKINKINYGGDLNDCLEKIESIKDF